MVFNNKIKIPKELLRNGILREDDINLFKSVNLETKLRWIKNRISGYLTIDFGDYTKKYKLPKELQELILKRDGYKCIFCHSQENLHIHHIIPRTINGCLKEKQANLITVCKGCHKGIHFYLDTTNRYIKKFEKEYRNSKIDYYFKLLLETEVSDDKQKG